MITQPTMQRLLECIRTELTDTVIPAIDDATIVVNVQMITAVLSQLEERVEHELDWMRSECEAIEAAAHRLLGHHPDAAPVTEALETYRTARTDSLLVSEAREDYERASELLSRVAEAAYSIGDPAAIADVEELFEDRLATEQAAIGTFISVGRES